MNKHDRDEAARIAGELEKANWIFCQSKQAGLDPNKLETMLLAKAVQIFEGTLDAEWLSPRALAQRQHEAAL